LSRCGLISKAHRLAQPTRVGHPVPDVAAPAAKVLRFGADPGASIDRGRTGARPTCYTRSGLRSRPLGRPWGAPQQNSILRAGRFSLEPSCPYSTFCTTRPASPRASRASCSTRALSERAHVPSPHQHRSVPSYLYRGERERSRSRGLRPRLATDFQPFDPSC
jgi:hypothetical protein